VRVVIPLFDGMTMLDAVGPYEVLSRIPEAEIIVAAKIPGEVRNDMRSFALVADRWLDDIRDADVLVVPGGTATRALVYDQQLVEWIRAIHHTTTWTTSVCTGSLLLGAAGALEGLQATTHWLELDRLREFGATPSNERVVVQGKVITAAGVSAGIDMALTLAALLAGDQVAQAIQLSIEYDPQPPFRAGSPATAPPDVVDVVRRIALQRQGAAT
jgi:transcriptional regulator GlxA family with amidase domain